MTRSASQPDRPVNARRFSNNWPTVPLRIFLAALFLFAGYAKLTYPGFLDPNASFGFKSAVQSAKADSPIHGLLTPMINHASFFGHVTAYAELAIGLGLLVGLLTRIAAVGGIVLVGLIVLSVNWNSVKQYTGSSGWFTSVDLAVAAALSVFLLGGAGPLSLDGAISSLRARRRARDEAEPSFSYAGADLEGSRRRLRGDLDDDRSGTMPTGVPYGVPFTGGQGYDTERSVPESNRPGNPDEDGNDTRQLPNLPDGGNDGESLWNEPRRQ